MEETSEEEMEETSEEEMKETSEEQMEQKPNSRDKETDIFASEEEIWAHWE